MRKLASLLCCAAVAVCGLGSNFASARPNYLPEFKTAYPELKEAENAKCAICHPGKEKKERNNYGKAFGTELGAKNVKDKEALAKAFTAAAAKPSGVEGKTFGDLIKEGKLPGEAPKAE